MAWSIFFDYDPNPHTLPGPTILTATFFKKAGMDSQLGKTPKKHGFEILILTNYEDFLKIIYYKSHFCQHIALYYGWSYCLEPFRPIASYCPEPFRPIASYCPEPFRPITSCSRTCCWPVSLIVNPWMSL